MPITEALQMPISKLQILHNEAVRQRTLDGLALRIINASKEDVEETVEELKLIHGDYTEGFYEEQLLALKQLFGWSADGRNQTDKKNSN